MELEDDISFHKHFNYGSILSVIIFILGIEIIILFLKNEVSLGNILMLGGIVIYILNNIILNSLNLKSHFNDFLENLAVFLTFGITTIIFGILHFENNLLLLTVIFIYAICIILSLSRNKVSHLTNSIGWPVALNGLFFPLTYYIYEFYLFDMGIAIFLLFYIIVAILMISKFDFLGSTVKEEQKIKKEFEEKTETIIPQKNYQFISKNNKKRKLSFDFFKRKEGKTENKQKINEDTFLGGENPN